MVTHIHLIGSEQETGNTGMGLPLNWRCERRIFLALLCFAAIGGCSRGDGMVQIRGTVKLDSNPVEEGLIAFVPAAGETAKAEAMIENGTYSVRVMPGEKVVEIRGFKTVGHEHAVKGNSDSPLLPIRKNIVPARYNDKSELTRTISADSSIEDFDLDSK